MENNKRESRQSAVSIGQRLREAREKKSLAIEQIQKTTKIHSSVLIALEEGRASEILTDTYVRSFLKKYAQVLDLPANELLKEYFPPHAEPAGIKEILSEQTMPKETLLPPKALYFTGILVAIFAALLILIFIGGRIVAALKNVKFAGPRKAVATAPTMKNKTAKAAKTAKQAQKRRSPANARTEPKDLVPRQTPLSLVIKVKEPVLVNLKRDGVLIFERVMSRGVVETVTANDNMELEISRADALELALNGNQIILPPRKSMFDLIITRKGVRIK